MRRFKAIQIYLLLILILSVSFIAGCGGGGETGHWLPSRVLSIAVTPATASIPMGAPQQFVAVATYSDGTSRDVTATSIWSSAVTGVATINSASGLAVGVAIGTSVITADFDGKSGSANLTVTVAALSSIAVTPLTASTPMGLTKTFVATGTFTDGTTRDISNIATWSSGTVAVATVVSPGVATGQSIGTATITATSGGKSGSATLNVTAATLSSIAVTPVTATTPMGLTKTFVATGTYSDGTTLDISNTVTWSSGALAIATIVSPGVATGRSVGTALITASLGTKSGSATLSVTAATLSSIVVTPATATTPMGLTKTFVATGAYSDGTSVNISNTVTWSSGATAVATVVSPGVATGHSVGTATITATLSGRSGSAALTVTPATLSSIVVTPLTATTPMGLTKTFVAMGAYSDGTSVDISNLVTWSSGATAVATVVSPGVATGLSVGTAAITATLSGKSGSATLSVTPATLSSIVVTPLTATTPMGLTKTFVATGAYSDGTSVDISNLVTWSSGATAVATVVSPGVATGLSVGAATITATLSGKSGSATLNVTAATLSSIAVTPLTATVAIGGTQTFVAKGTYSNGSIVDISNLVTWTSGALAVATVVSPGVATGLSGGTATITATSGAKSGSGVLTVLPASVTLNSIAVTPLTATVAIGGTQTFVAKGTYSDGSIVDISNTVTWTSGTLAVATVVSPGVATGLSGGTATITATSGAKSGSGALTVLPAAVTLNSIAVTPVAPSVAIGYTQAFVAMGTYSDGSIVDITNIVLWSSNNLPVATVLSTGVATGLSAGIATITATSGTKSGFGTLTVDAPLGPPAVILGLAGNFAGLSKAGITDVPSSAIIGSIGASPISGAAIGVTCPEVTGTIYAVDAAGPAPCAVIDPVMLTTAVQNLQDAYTDAAGRPAGVGPNLNLGAGTVAGQTLVPGTYTWGSNVTITTDLTLNGGPNDVWIFQITGTLDLSSNKQIILTGGALPKNIFWQVAGAVTLFPGSHFEGTILAQTNIAMQTGASMNGRLLAQTGVSLQQNAVTIPEP
ncbi:MAG: Ig-like domain-containing protein [Syntrophales bacterium]